MTTFLIIFVGIAVIEALIIRLLYSKLLKEQEHALEKFEEYDKKFKKLKKSYEELTKGGKDEREKIDAILSGSNRADIIEASKKLLGGDGAQ